VSSRASQDWTASLRQASSVEVTAHRPWPLPRAPWISGQSWRDLLFAHWPVDPAELAPYVPEGLELDLWEGQAWLGVVPFEVIAVRVRPFPPVPGLSRFLEANVRTYVRHGDRPGVLFLTLEASSALAVNLAQALYRLPYHQADMDLGREGQSIDFRSERERLRVTAQYVGEGRVFPAREGSFDEFLVERYCLYTRSAGVLFRADIHHRPWRLQRAAAGSSVDVELQALGPFALGSGPHLRVAGLQDVVIWPLLPVGRSGQA
jgi:uncharacterized protein YqjF (DUF2071 family)